MTEAELIEKCESDQINWAKGEKDGILGYWLHWKDPYREDTGECCFVQEDALEGLTWAVVYHFVVDGRNVYHMSRVVGYLSRIENWNSGKIGELKDRRRGRYGVVAESSD